MPDFLALEWEQDRVDVVVADVSSGAVRVRKCFTLSKPENITWWEPEVAGRWLKTELATHGVRGERTLITLPREITVVKRFDFPNVPEEELAQAVRFHVGAKSSAPIDELAFDYVPLPRVSAELPGREVLTATLPKAALNGIVATCAAAGCELVSLGLTPIAISQLIARADDAAGAASIFGASLVVFRHRSRIEISVLRQGHLLFSHAARLTADDPKLAQQAIVSEVSRALVALNGMQSGVKIDRGWMLVESDDNEFATTSLSTRLGCEVRPLDPFSLLDCELAASELPPDRSEFAGPIGMLLAQAEARVPTLDFLNPRKPPVKRNVRKQRATAIAVGVAALLALTGSVYAWHLHGLSKQIDDLAGEDRHLKTVLERGEATLKSVALVRQWNEATVPWLDEAVRFSEKMPPTDRIYLSSVRFDPQTGKTLGKIKFEGYARDRSDVMSLSEKLVGNDEKYRTLPHIVRPDPKDSVYPWRFDEELLISRVVAKAEKKSAAAKPASTPDKLDPTSDKPGGGTETKPADTRDAAPQTTAPSPAAATPVYAAPAPSETKTQPDTKPAAATESAAASKE
jgi:Tfp pilus assembly PilM family ATPase